MPNLFPLSSRIIILLSSLLEDDKNYLLPTYIYPSYPIQRPRTTPGCPAPGPRPSVQRFRLPRYRGPTLAVGVGIFEIVLWYSQCYVHW